MPKGLWVQVPPLVFVSFLRYNSYPPRVPNMGITVHWKEWIHKPSVRIEQFILNLPYDRYRAEKSCEYARKVLHDRFIPGERYIKRFPDVAVLYARHVLKGPWPEAEASIRRSFHSFYSYSKYVRKDFEGADKVLRAEFKKGGGISNCAFLYCRYVRKKQWPLLEKLVNQTVSKDENRSWVPVEHMVAYTLKFRKKRWEEIEGKIIDGNDCEDIEKYASVLTPSEKEEFNNRILMMAMDYKNPYRGSLWEPAFLKYAKKMKIGASTV